MSRPQGKCGSQTRGRGLGRGEAGARPAPRGSVTARDTRPLAWNPCCHGNSPDPRPLGLAERVAPGPPTAELGRGRARVSAKEDPHCSFSAQPHSAPLGSDGTGGMAPLCTSGSVLPLPSWDGEGHGAAVTNLPECLSPAGWWVGEVCLKTPQFQGKVKGRHRGLLPISTSGQAQGFCSLRSPMAQIRKTGALGDLW